MNYDGVSHPPLLLKDNPSVEAARSKVRRHAGDVNVYAVDGELYKTKRHRADGTETTAKLITDDNMVVNFPHHAVARMVSNQTNISTSTPTLLQFNTIVEDYDSMVVGSNGRITVHNFDTDHVIVLINVQLHMDDLQGVTTTTKLYLFKNGALLQQRSFTPMLTEDTIGATFVSRASANDYFDVRVTHSVANADVLSGTDADDSYFSVSVVNTFNTPAS